MIILNKHIDKIPANSIYIGRGSIFGNPFVIGKHGDRDKVIEKYEKYINEEIVTGNSIIIDAFNALKESSVLVCFCKPKKCHGDIIQKIWNEKFKK